MPANFYREVPANFRIAKVIANETTKCSMQFQHSGPFGYAGNLWEEVKNRLAQSDQFTSIEWLTNSRADPLAARRLNPDTPRDVAYGSCMDGARGARGI